jgi:hypothetical protein
MGKQPSGPPPKWNNRRVLIFTENREETKRYLKTILEQAIEYTDGADARIEVIDGLTSSTPQGEPKLFFAISSSPQRSYRRFQSLRCGACGHLWLVERDSSPASQVVNEILCTPDITPAKNPAGNQLSVGINGDPHPYIASIRTLSCDL